MSTPPTPDAHAEPSRLPTPGTLVAEKYELIRLIGSGGMGTVWEARHRFTHAHVAVKLLNPGYAADAGMTSRFLKEARAVTAIGHPNLVRVLDMGPSELGFYMAQELLVGRNLFEALGERTSFAPHALWTLLRPIAEALQAAHEVGVIHRDIKPENIFLATAPDGAVTPRLIDFGIAKSVVTGRDATHLTAPNQTPGTPAYMAPEQHMGEVALDARADVWAFGVVLHECLTGTHPFPGVTGTAVMLSILEGRAAPLASPAWEIPPGVVAVIGRAMAVDRTQRPPTMRALIDAMDDALGASPPIDVARAPTLPADERATGPRRGAPHSSLVPVQRPSESDLQAANPASAPRPLRSLAVVAAIAAGVALLSAVALSHRATAAPPRPAAPVVAPTVEPPRTVLVVPATPPAIVDAGAPTPPPPPPPRAVVTPRPRSTRVGATGAPRTTASPLGVQDEYE